MSALEEMCKTSNIKVRSGLKKMEFIKQMRLTLSGQGNS